METLGILQYLVQCILLPFGFQICSGFQSLEEFEVTKSEQKIMKAKDVAFICARIGKHMCKIWFPYHLGMQLQNTRRVTIKVAKQTQIGARMAGMNSEAVQSMTKDSPGLMIQQSNTQGFNPPDCNG